MKLNAQTLPHRIAHLSAAACLALAASSAYAQPGLGLGVSVGTKVDAVGVALTDTGITGKVKTRIATDAALGGSAISVDTKSGVTTLTGTVPTLDAKLAAEKLVSGTEGVMRVDNRLVVTAGLPPDVAAKAEINTGVERASAKLEAGLEKAEVKTEAAANTSKRVITDTWVTTKVKSQLLADTLAQGSKISVKTKGKVVYLSGTASSQAEKDQAIALAQQTEGVVRVHARKLRVSAQASGQVN